MSRDVFVIHSSEVDAPGLLADGWYVAMAYPDEDVCTDNLHSGPCATHDEAIQRMRDWMLS